MCRHLKPATDYLDYLKPKNLHLLSTLSILKNEVGCKTQNHNGGAGLPTVCFKAPIFIFYARLTFYQFLL